MIMQATIHKGTATEARISQWSVEIPTEPGWYWLRHAVFSGKAGAWHELHPIIVELGRNGNAPLVIFVSGSEWVRSVEDLVVGEWVGPLEMPQ